MRAGKERVPTAVLIDSRRRLVRRMARIEERLVGIDPDDPATTGTFIALSRDLDEVEAEIESLDLALLERGEFDFDPDI